MRVTLNKPETLNPKPSHLVPHILLRLGTIFGGLIYQAAHIRCRDVGFRVQGSWFGVWGSGFRSCLLPEPHIPAKSLQC